VHSTAHIKRSLMITLPGRSGTVWERRSQCSPAPLEATLLPFPPLPGCPRVVPAPETVQSCLLLGSSPRRLAPHASRVRGTTVSFDRRKKGSAGHEAGLILATAACIPCTTGWQPQLWGDRRHRGSVAPAVAVRLPIRETVTRNFAGPVLTLWFESSGWNPPNQRVPDF